MINLNDCIEIGRLTRPHGYKGNLILRLISLSFDEITEMEWVFVLIDGLPVPFFVEEFSEKSKDTVLVKLEDISSIDHCQELIDTPVYLFKDIIQPDTTSLLGLNQCVGYKVIDSGSGELGKLQGVIDNPSNPLLQIIDFRKEILIPAQEEFIDSIDDAQQEIHVSCPPGLLDIY